MKPIVAFLLCCVAALLAVLGFTVMRCRHVARAQKEELARQKVHLEKQVAKAKEAARAKSDFLSRMSHEIRTPLNAIIGMVQIAQNASTAAKVTDCLNKVESSSKHLLGVVNDILDFSKIDSDSLVLERKLFSLTQNIHFVLSMMQVKAEEKGVNLSARAACPQHDGVETDMLRLNQVLINLLSNAIKFTENGGDVNLDVEELAHYNGESTYRFTVQDTGVGIAPEQAKKLFTPFTQANASVARLYGGTGLGLAISQRIVQMMGGDIEVETELGKGSVFWFTIRVPAKGMDPAPTPTPQPEEDLADLCGKRILVVDDIEINREVVAGLLDGSGVIIDHAANGKEAYDAFCNRDSRYYDLILMDMQMPVMDGCAAAREIRACGKEDAANIKIIAMTANVMPEDVEMAYAAGMDDYLPKPIDFVALSQKLGACL